MTPRSDSGSIIWKVFARSAGESGDRAFCAAWVAVRRRPRFAVHRFSARAPPIWTSAAADKAQSNRQGALSERPQLKIEVPIAWGGDLDRPALIENTVHGASPRSAVGQAAADKNGGRLMTSCSSSGRQSRIIGAALCEESGWRAEYPASRHQPSRPNPELAAAKRTDP